MLFLSALPFQILLGAISAYIAYKKNRNYIAWFFGGFLLGLIGVITILILPPIEITSNSNQESQKKIEDYIKKNIPPSLEDVEKLTEETSFWYYLDENKQNVGPIEFEQLIEEINKFSRKKETWIWKKGMPDWQRAKDIPSIDKRLN